MCVCCACVCGNNVCDFVQFVSPCVGGSIVPPHTLYRIKCVLAVIYLGVKNKMVASTSCVKKTLARSLQHKTQTSLDTDRSRPTREGASRRPYAEAHAQVRPTGLPPYQPFKGSLLLAFQAESVQPSFAAVTESRKSTESGRKAAESWTSPRCRLPSA